MKYLSKTSQTVKELVGIEVSRFTLTMPSVGTILFLSADAAYKAQMYRLTALLSAMSAVVFYDVVSRIYKQINKIKE